MMGQQTESNSFYREIFFYSLRKTFGRLSDTSKKAERSSAVNPTKCSFRFVRVLESDSALHQEPGHGPPLAGEQPNQYFLSDCLLHRSESAVNPSLRDTGQTMSESISDFLVGRTCLLSLP